jgi:zinc transporter, ZIP family
VRPAAVALVVVAVASGCGGSSTPAELAVTQSTLRPGQIALVVSNGGEEAARIAQVILNDAFVDFRASRPELLPGKAETITVTYEWIRGENYDIRLMTSTGRTVDYEIEEAA